MTRRRRRSHYFLRVCATETKRGAAALPLGSVLVNCYGQQQNGPEGAVWSLLTLANHIRTHRVSFFHQSSIQNLYADYFCLIADWSLFCIPLLTLFFLPYLLLPPPLIPAALIISPLSSLLARQTLLLSGSLQIPFQSAFSPPCFLLVIALRCARRPLSWGWDVQESLWRAFFSKCCHTF